MNRVFSKLTVLGVLTVFALCLFFYPPLFAQDDETSQLRNRITQLEDKVKQLEVLLEQCKQGLKSQYADEMAWQNKKNWRSLSPGMNEEQVMKILGEPVKVIKGVKTLWYYPNIYGGNVSFDDKGRLTGWNEP